MLSGFEALSVNPAICGGRPILTGTRVRVTDVLEMLAAGASEAEILDDFPYITLEHIRACLGYAAVSLNHSVVAAA